VDYGIPETTSKTAHHKTDFKLFINPSRGLWGTFVIMIYFFACTQCKKYSCFSLKVIFVLIDKKSKNFPKKINYLWKVIDSTKM
jgi:F0F1-type ATP synthase gamma subunit